MYRYDQTPEKKDGFAFVCMYIPENTDLQVNRDYPKTTLIYRSIDLTLVRVQNKILQVDSYRLLTNQKVL